MVFEVENQFAEVKFKAMSLSLLPDSELEINHYYSTLGVITISLHFLYALLLTLQAEQLI
jgi:hypothetical protein